MNHLTRPMPADHDIILMGDCHHGLKASSPKVFESARERVLKNKATYIIFMGDLVEGREPHHDYYSIEATDLTKGFPQIQAEHVAEMLKPLASKTLCYLIGNHEWHMIRKAGDIYLSTICRPLGIPYGGFSTRLTITDFKGRLRYKMYLTHGWGSITTTADDPVRQLSNMGLALKRKLKNKSADCVIMAMGHTHKLLVVKPSRTMYLSGHGELRHNYLQHAQDAEYIHPDHRWYINTGSSLLAYADGHTTYAELSGYDPLELGYAVIKVRNGLVNDVERVVV